jgi:hypothetical protein
VDAVHLSRLTTVLAVGTVGGVAGHVLVPFSPGAGAGRVALFVALVAGTGAVRGWRARVLDADLHGVPPAGIGRAAALYGLGSVGVAMLGFVVVHGLPFG